MANIFRPPLVYRWAAPPSRRVAISAQSDVWTNPVLLPTSLSSFYWDLVTPFSPKRWKAAIQSQLDVQPAPRLLNLTIPLNPKPFVLSEQPLPTPVQPQKFRVAITATADRSSTLPLGIPGPPAGIPVIQTRMSLCIGIGIGVT